MPYKDIEKRRQKAREYSRLWKLRNKDKIKEYNKNKYKTYDIEKRKKWYENTKKWHKANRNYEINRGLKRRYGITLEQKQHMLQSQNNKCMICRKEFNINNLSCIDHNHTNGKVRDILCKNCNFIVGNCLEEINILYKTIEYLKKWEDN